MPTSLRGVPARKKLEDDEIIERSMRAFWSTGWSGTSIRDLEGALGLAAPTIYRRVGSKDELFIAAVRCYIERIVEQRIAKYLPPDSGDPLGDLWAFCASALVDGEQPRSQGCLLTLAANEAPALSPAAQREVRCGIERLRQAPVDAVGRAAALGQLDTEDPEALGDHVAIAMQGLLVLSRGGVDRGELERRATNALAEIRPEGAKLTL